MYPNQTHRDPGKDWDWSRYYKLINDDPTITNFSAGSGIFMMVVAQWEIIQMMKERFTYLLLPAVGK
ncbi:MAG: hypothetical protein IPL42_01460 [Saprospiraceae bacterium]|nr:hypothetical protein [Saprospiraceae bacterium]